MKTFKEYILKGEKLLQNGDFLCGKKQMNHSLFLKKRKERGKKGRKEDKTKPDEQQ